MSVESIVFQKIALACGCLLNSKKDMEREIGEKFKYKKVTLEVVKSHKTNPLYPCCYCYFLSSCRCYKVMNITGKCGNRGDKREVYFKEVSK